MKYKLISIDDSVFESEQAIVTVWCEPSWFDSLMGLKAECLAFIGSDANWESIDQGDITPHEFRMLNQIWAQHTRPSNVTNE
ncbi:hypothetical protein [Rhodopirellula baltica]|uniref:Uncharacterized protein n=1 Tax=Rhodopirellula baltica SWK14 TaxID=993516 RepID=L7CL72_RHOBT|nr:hypothetical protein [Rhodopirellula baltica]ELP34595.1 hypothetical protein RBSWK_01494 [Rhodopirellula baltica SWK14]